MSGRDERRLQRPYARNVTERHSRSCGLALGAACTCTPRFRMRVKVAGAWVTETYAAAEDALRAAEAHQSRQDEQSAVDYATLAPRLRQVATNFIKEARAGKVTTGGERGRGRRRRYAATTITNYETALRVHVLGVRVQGRCLGDFRVDEIDEVVLDAAVEALMGAGCSDATVRGCHAALRRVLHHALLGGWLVGQIPDPVPLPPPPPKRTWRWSTLQSDRVLAAAIDDDRRRTEAAQAASRPGERPAPVHTMEAAVRLMRYSLRDYELRNVRLGRGGLDLASEPARLTIGISKTPAGHRTIVLGDEDAAALRGIVCATGMREGGYLFPGPRGDGPAGRGGAIRCGLERIAHIVGFAVSNYWFRHTAGSELAAANRDQAANAELMGIASAWFYVSRYVHANPDDLANGWRNVEHRRARERELHESDATSDDGEGDKPAA